MEFEAVSTGHSREGLKRKTDGGRQRPDGESPLKIEELIQKVITQLYFSVVTLLINQSSLLWKVGSCECRIKTFQ